MTTRRDITWRQGAKLSELLTTDASLTGRSLRCHVRKRKSDPEIMLAFTSAGPSNQRITAEAGGIRITLGAIAGESVQTAAADGPWVYDVEAVLDADQEDVIRTHEGAWIVSADVTRSGTQTPASPDSDMRYVRYDTAQTLTQVQRDQALSNLDISNNVITVTAAESIAARRFVTLGGGYPLYGEKAIGVSLNSASAGQPVRVLTFGITQVEAGDLIEAGGEVFANDGSGKAFTFGDVALGVAISGASGDGALFSCQIRPMSCQILP